MPWIEHPKAAEDSTAEDLASDGLALYPCYFPSDEHRALGFANLPAVFASGSGGRPYGLALITVSAFGSFSRAKLLADAVGLGLLIFLQWVLVGAAPILRFSRINLPRLAGCFTPIAGLLVIAQELLKRYGETLSWSWPLQFCEHAFSFVILIFGLPLLVYWLIWLLVSSWKLIRWVARLPLRDLRSSKVPM